MRSPPVSLRSRGAWLLLRHNVRYNIRPTGCPHRGYGSVCYLSSLQQVSYVSRYLLQRPRVCAHALTRALSSLELPNSPDLNFFRGFLGPRCAAQRVLLASILLASVLLACQLTLPQRCALAPQGPPSASAFVGCSRPFFGRPRCPSFAPAIGWSPGRVVVGGLTRRSHRSAALHALNDKRLCLCCGQCRR